MHRDRHGHVGGVGEDDEQHAVDDAHDADEAEQEPRVAHGDLGDARHGDEHAEHLERLDAGGDRAPGGAVQVEHVLVDEGQQVGTPKRATPRNGTANQIRRIVRTLLEHPHRRPDAARAPRRRARSPRRRPPPCARGSRGRARGAGAPGARRRAVGMAKTKNGARQPEVLAPGRRRRSGPRIWPTEFAWRWTREHLHPAGRLVVVGQQRRVGGRDHRPAAAGADAHGDEHRRRIIDGGPVPTENSAQTAAPTVAMRTRLPRSQ